MSLSLDVSKSASLSRINGILSSKLKASAFLGYLLVLAASVLAGMADVLPKPILGEDSSLFVNPILFVFMIYLANGLFFSCIAKKKTGTIKSKTIFFLALIGIAEAAGTIAYYLGLKETNAINASILGNGETIFAIIIAMIIFRERLQRIEVLPLVLIIFGAILFPTAADLFTNGFELSKFVFGDALILISGAFYATDVIISRFVCQRVDSKRIMQISSITAALFSLLVLVLLEIPIEFDINHLPVMFTTGIFGMGLSSMFFIIGLKLIGAVRSILIYSTTTIFGIVFAVLYLGEMLNMANVICVMAVIAGIYLLRKKLGRD